MNGQLYRGSKPVMWRPVERTALADAEVEYHDHAQPDDLGEVPGRCERAPTAELGRRLASVIWTTTPWTIPANRAITYPRHRLRVYRGRGEAPDGQPGPSRATG